VSLSKKTSRTLYSQYYTIKTDAVQNSAVQVGEWNSEMMFSAGAWRYQVSGAGTLDDKLFQMRGEATKKARSTIVEW